PDPFSLVHRPSTCTVVIPTADRLETRCSDVRVFRSAIVIVLVLVLVLELGSPEESSTSTSTITSMSRSPPEDPNTRTPEHPSRPHCPMIPHRREVPPREQLSWLDLHPVFHDVGARGFVAGVAGHVVDGDGAAGAVGAVRRA